MKKYTLILFVFAVAFVLLGVSAKSARADSFDGCGAAGPYSTLTGQLCVNPTEVVGCQPGFLFSPVTGQSCSTSNLPPGCNTTFGFSPITGQSCNVGFNFPPGCSSNVGFSITTGQSCSGSIFTPPPAFPPGCFSTFGQSTIDGQSCGIFNSQPPIISGVNGPQSLNVNQQGTWNVTAFDPRGGNLSYSVNWGDQIFNNNGALSSPQFFPQQSATFTHAYSQAGNYTPIFTVTSNNTIQCFTIPCPSNGGSAQTSLSVNVGGTTSFSSLNILTDSTLPSGQTNSSYYATISGSGGTGNYTWNIRPNNLFCVSGLSCGTLPSGLTLSQIFPPCVFGASLCPSQATITGVPNIAGNYTFAITLTDSNGSSVSKSFTINIGGITGQAPNISFLSPTSGAIGTQVNIFGSGLSGATVNFGGHSSISATNFSDSQISFIVPSSLSNNNCGLGLMCAQYIIPVNPGFSYPVSVSNGFGVSNSVNFVVSNF